MQRTLILVVLSVAISVGFSLLVASLVKIAPQLKGRIDDINMEEVVEEAQS